MPHPSTHVSIHPCIQSFIYQSITHPSMHKPIHPHIPQSIHLPTHPSNSSRILALALEFVRCAVTKLLLSIEQAGTFMEKRVYNNSDSFTIMKYLAD